MAEFEVVDVSGRTAAPRLPTPSVTSGSVPVNGDERAALQALRDELDGYYKAVKTFSEQEPDVVLQQIAGYSARLCELRALLQRNGSIKANQFRTREVDPLMEQLDFQFKIASRLLSAREFDFRLSGGGV